MGDLGGLAKDTFVMLVGRVALGGHGMLVLGAFIEDESWHGEAT